MKTLNASFKEQLNAFGRDRTACLFVIDFAMKRPLLWRLDEIQASELLYNFNGIGNDIGRRPKQVLPTLAFDKFPVDPATYQDAFQQVQAGLQYGDSFLTNLTFPTKIKLNWTLESSFHQVQAKYKLWLKDRFLSFSPETFIQIGDDRIHSFPMKGTRPALLESDAERLLADPKERAEHATIVDLIRNDLSQVAKRVRVTRYRYLEYLNTSAKALWQTSTHIQGDLPTNWQDHLGDILANLLPAGSISGAPKTKTVELIRQAEGQDRGYYTGIAGIFDGHSLDTGVLIRFIEHSKEGLRYWSGGGITANSQWQEEYQELIEKVYLPINHAESCDRVECLSAPLAFHTDVATPF